MISIHEPLEKWYNTLTIERCRIWYTIVHSNHTGRLKHDSYLNSSQETHSSPSRLSYGSPSRSSYRSPVLSILGKDDHVLTRIYCTSMTTAVSLLLFIMAKGCKKYIKGVSRNWANPLKVQLVSARCRFHRVSIIPADVPASKVLGHLQVWCWLRFD